MNGFSLYQKTAVNVLQSPWSGLSYEEACDKVVRSTNIELEANHVKGMDSLIVGIRALAKYGAGGKTYDVLDGYSDDELRQRLITNDKELEEKIEAIVHDGLEDHMDVLLDRGVDISDKSYTSDYIYNLTMACTREIHDAWCQRNLDGFVAEKTEIQYLPYEMIGVEQAKLDYLFFKPVLEVAGFSQYMGDRDFEEAYRLEADRFRIEKRLNTERDIKTFVEGGSASYFGLQGLDKMFGEEREKKVMDIVQDFYENGAGKDIYQLNNRLQFLNISNDGWVPGDCKIDKPISLPVICSDVSGQPDMVHVWLDSSTECNVTDSYNAPHTYRFDKNDEFIVDDKVITPIPLYDVPVDRTSDFAAERSKLTAFERMRMERDKADKDNTSDVADRHFGDN